MISVRYLILQILAFCCCTTEALTNENVLKFQVMPEKCTEMATYNIIVNTSYSLHETDAKYLSVAIGSQRVTSKWSGSQKLINLASALSPCEIRLGGTSADFLQFDPSANTCQNDNQIEFSDKVDIYDSGYFGLGVGKDIENFTMTAKHWDGFTSFVAQAGWDLLFDVNLFFWRSDGSWDQTNAELLLNYSSKKGIRIPYFQLGNEPNAFFINFGFRVYPETLVNNFKILKNLTSKYPLYASSKLYGPDVTNVELHGAAKVYFHQFVAAGGYNVVDEYSLHHYYLNGCIATELDFLSISTLESLREVLQVSAHITKASPRPLPIRLTETSSCYGGGAPDLSDRFLAGFLWLDKLGMTAQYGITKVFRQTFTGSAYALLTNSFDPTPDYYLSVIYKRLVQGPVFNISLGVTSSPNVRVYAHCARRGIYSPGALVIYYLNLNEAQAVLSFGQFPDANLDLYLLTPGDNDGLVSRYVKLNGNTLLMAGNELPPMPPKPYTGDVNVAAQSFGFIVIPQANVRLCVNYFEKIDSKMEKS